MNLPSATVGSWVIYLLGTLVLALVARIGWEMGGVIWKML